MTAKPNRRQGARAIAQTAWLLCSTMPPHSRPVRVVHKDGVGLHAAHHGRPARGRHLLGQGNKFNSAVPVPLYLHATPTRRHATRVVLTTCIQSTCSCHCTVPPRHHCSCSRFRPANTPEDIPWTCRPLSYESTRPTCCTCDNVWKAPRPFADLHPRTVRAAIMQEEEQVLPGTRQDTSPAHAEYRTVRMAEQPGEGATVAMASLR